MKQIYMIFLLFAGFFLYADSIDQQIQRDFGFGSMEIFEFQSKTSCLAVRDMNKDHLADVLFLNNGAARLEILIRKKKKSQKKGYPTLAESFSNKGINLDHWVDHFVVTDLNGDTLPDILILDKQRGLQVMMQSSSLVFNQPRQLYIKEADQLVGFLTADLNGDAQTDILSYSRKEATLFYHQGNGEFKIGQRLNFSSYGCQTVFAEDINNDTFIDLIFLFPKDKLPLKIRMGSSKGMFGWEESFNLPDLNAVKITKFGERILPYMAVIQKNGSILQFYQFKQSIKNHLSSRHIAAKTLPLSGIGRDTNMGWLVDDFNRDGCSDFCVPAPLLSQIHLFWGKPGGMASQPQKIESLNGITSLSLLRGRGILAFSKVEKSVAYHPFHHLSGFSKMSKIGGEPLALTSINRDQVLMLAKAKQKYHFNLYGFTPERFKLQQSFPVHLSQEPAAIKAIPLNNENHWLIFLFRDYEQPLIYRFNQNRLIPLEKRDSDLVSRELKPPMVLAMTHHNKQLLAVCENKIIRFYRWNKDRLELFSQLNPNVENASLSAACLLPDPSDSSKVLIYDENNQDIYWFSQDSLDLEFTQHINTPLKSNHGIAPIHLKDQRGILVFAGPEVQWLAEKCPAMLLQKVNEYTSKADDSLLWEIFPISLGNRGRKLLVLLDANNRSLEFIGFHKDGLVAELVFEIFKDADNDRKMGKRLYEPHHVASGDINGDGIFDLAVLVHDKLILYLGE